MLGAYYSGEPYPGQSGRQLSGEVDTRSAEITGQDASDAERVALITGILRNERAATIAGRLSISSEISGVITGVITASVDRSAEIKGRDTDSNERAAKILGRLTISNEIAAIISGKPRTPIDVYPGTISENPAGYGEENHRISASGLDTPRGYGESDAPEGFTETPSDSSMKS